MKTKNGDFKHKRNEPDTTPENVVNFRSPPRNIEAERAVLGTGLLVREQLDVIFTMIKPQDMYLDKHQLIMESMLTLHLGGNPVDLISVSEHLNVRGVLNEAGGLSYLSQLGDQIPHVANIEYYLRIVREDSEARQLLQIMLNKMADIYEKSYEDFNEFVDGLETEVLDVRASRTDDAGLEHLREARVPFFAQLEQTYYGGAVVSGVSTGLEDLDELLGALVDSNLIILAGRPSAGKTATALQFALNAALNTDSNKAVAIFSAEMSSDLLYKRLIANLSGVSGNRIAGREKLRDSDFARLTQAAIHLKDMPIYVDDKSSPTLSYMRSKLNRLRSELGKAGKTIGLVIVDYLQFMGNCLPTGTFREQEIAHRSYGLKGIAKDYGVPVVAISQLNRDLEKRPCKRPIMSDLRESGAIENDADVIMFCYRDEVYNEDTEDRGIMELIIGKHRDGPLGTVRTRFIKDTGTIKDLTPEDQDVSSFAGRYS